MADTLWSRDGDEDKWPALVDALSDEHLAVFYNNVKWARQQCFGAWQLMNGMMDVMQEEKEKRARKEHAQENKRKRKT